MGTTGSSEGFEGRCTVVIELIDVQKAYGTHKLYDSINLTIDDGEFVILSGPSGCGKTTLLNMIGGIEPIDSGRLLVNGRDIAVHSELMKFYQNEVGFLFQNFALVELMTVKQNLDLVYKKSREQRSFSDALKMVGLEDKINEPIYRLSGGEQQRVALARLLIKRCNIILADEPTGSLDRQNADRVMDILCDIHRMGKTIIMVTHDDCYRGMASRVIDIPKIFQGWED